MSGSTQPEAGSGAQPDAPNAPARDINWGRAILFFLLGFLLLAEPLMLILLLHKNGTF